MNNKKTKRFFEIHFEYRKKDSNGEKQKIFKTYHFYTSHDYENDHRATFVLG